MYQNPYYDQNFLSFFWVLLQRIYAVLTGQLSFSDLASDEVQMLVLMGVATSAALVGSFLILRRMTMLANSLSHTILLGIVLAYLFTHQVGLGDDSDHPGSLNIHVMLIAAALTGVITAYLTEFLTKTVRLQEDASIGLVFTTLFALGIILVTLLTRNIHIGTEVVMGNVDALHIDDIKLVYVILAANVLLIVLCFKEYKVTTFDPQLAKALGYSTAFFNYLLMLQVSATCVGAFRAVGVLMVLALITGPALTARLVTDRLKTMLLLAILLGCAASIVGVAISRHLLTVNGLTLSTAGLVVCVIAVIFTLTVVIKYLRHSIKQQFPLKISLPDE